MIALLIAATLAGGQAKTDAARRQPAPSPSRPQTETLRDWALARCLARGANGAFARDAAVSAAALLERGDYGIEAYEPIEALVGRQLAKRYGGSVPGDYVTLKCLDLYHGAALDRLVRAAKATPVR